MSCRTMALRLDQLQLLPVLAGRACLELGLVNLRAGLERVGAALIVVVGAVLVDVVAVLVVALVVVVVVALVVALVVARAVVTAVVAGVMVRPVVVVAAARRVRLEVARRVALDLGLIVDGAGELAAAGQRDRQHSALEGLDRAGVLLAVLDPVVVGIAVARVGLRAELAAIVEAVTILVPLGLLDLQRQVVSPLPAVRQLVVVVVTAVGRGRGSEPQHGHEGQGEDEELSHGRAPWRSGVVRWCDTPDHVRVTVSPRRAPASCWAREGRRCRRSRSLGGPTPPPGSSWARVSRPASRARTG